MSKREKVILALMLIVLLIAGYLFWFDSSPQDTNVATEKELANAKALSSQVTDDVRKKALTDIEKYVLERAEADWPKDPFLERRLSRVAETTKGGGGTRPSDYAFSGYVDVGNRRLAIINGVEYFVGDLLESGGYQVKSIDPEKVVLEDIDRRGRITIPFTGEIYYP